MDKELTGTCENTNGILDDSDTAMWQNTVSSCSGGRFCTISLCSMFMPPINLAIMSDGTLLVGSFHTICCKHHNTSTKQMAKRCRDAGIGDVPHRVSQ